MLLQSIRDKAQGFLAILILGIVAVVFVFWGVSSRQGGRRKQQVIALVDHQPITQAAFERAYKRYKRLRHGSPSGPPSPQRVKAVKQFLKQDLVDRYTFRTGVLRRGYRMSESQIEQRLIRLSQFQVHGRFSPSLYQKFLDTYFFTPDEYENILLEAGLKKQMQQGRADAHWILPEEIHDYLRLETQQRDIASMEIPLDYGMTKTHIDEAMAQDYYREHTRYFMREEAVKLQYLRLDPAALDSELALDRGSLKAYYKKNKALFQHPGMRQVAHIMVRLPKTADTGTLTAARKKIEAYQLKLKQGAHFSVLAKQHSEDAMSAAQGGRLPWSVRQIGRNRHAFRRAVFSIKQVGAVIGPIRTPNGFHLIKLLAVKAPRQAPLAAVEKAILQSLQREKLEDSWHQAMDTLQGLAYDNADVLDPIASALDLKVQTTGWLTRSSDHWPENGAKKIREAAFSDDVKHKGYNSALLEISPHRVIVLRVLAHRKAAPYPFEEVKARVYQMLHRQMAMQKTGEVGKQLFKQLKAKGSLAQAPEDLRGLRWHFYGRVRRNDTHVSSLVRELGFQLPKPMPGAKTLSMAGTETPEGGYSIVRLQHVHEKQNFAPPLQKRGYRLMEKYYAALEKQAYQQTLLAGVHVKWK